MPNVGVVLKEEILRVARKEIRSQLNPIRKATATHRKATTAFKREIQGLKKTIAGLRRLLSKANSGATPGNSEIGTPNGGRRFSAKGMATHRKRLGLSAAEYGKLIGVTAQSIYNWEAGTSRPARKHLDAIAATRTLGKRAAAERLG